MSHAKLIGRFFNHKRDDEDLNAAKLAMDEEADHIEIISRDQRVGCFDFTIPAPLRRQILMVVALSHDPHGSRRMAIEKIIAKGKTFTADDMLEEIRQEEILHLEMMESEKHFARHAENSRSDGLVAHLNAAALSRRATCYNFNSDAGCQRLNCIFEHRKLTDEENAKRAEDAKKRAVPMKCDYWFKTALVRPHASRLSKKVGGFTQPSTRHTNPSTARKNQPHSGLNTMTTTSPFILFKYK
jgi:hypothetical protein